MYLIMMMHTLSFIHRPQTTSEAAAGGGVQGGCFLLGRVQKNNKEKNNQRQKTDQSFYMSDPRRRCLLCLFVCLSFKGHEENKFSIAAAAATSLLTGSVSFYLNRNAT